MILYITRLLKTLFARTILLTDPCVEFYDRIDYYISIFIRIAPVAYIMKEFNWWYSDNEQFAKFMCWALIINMGVGIWFHLKQNTFSFKEFFIRNLEMAVLVYVVYFVLELLRYTAGDNIAGDIFKVSMQISTLLYPISKVLKNCFILSNGKIPSEYIMKRMYNFEKNGDLAAFFNEKNKEDGNGE